MSKTIPPVNLKRQYETLSQELDTAVLEILRSGHYIGGEIITKFEQQFADYTGVSYGVSCNSGTDALYLALQALDIKPGDEIITTPFTFIATAEVISRLGAIPVFVDINLETFNIDVKKIEAKITPKTKAIIPVHLFGLPVDMDELMAIAHKNNLFVIEDCAQATGGEWQGKKVGSIGHIGCFSFFPTKNLGTCGDGGAITTNDTQLAAKIRVLKEHGSAQRYHHEEIGINSRLDTIQGAILRVKLPHLDRWNEQRHQAAIRYHELLTNISHIQLPQGLTGAKHTWNQYTITIENTKDNRHSHQTFRDEIRIKLLEMGVIAMIYYPIPLHLQEVYKDLDYHGGDFPLAEKAAHTVLSLPMFPDITPQEQQQVVNSLKDLLK
jgi:dTDP-4-amino-4,6-dideoxygalactose transaminase